MGVDIIQEREDAAMEYVEDVVCRPCEPYKSDPSNLMHLSESDNLTESLLPFLTPDLQHLGLKIYHESRLRTDTKRLSADTLYSKTLINMIKNMEPIIVRNGKEWRRYSFKEVVILPPTTIRSDGQTERTVPLDCLAFDKGYTSDVYAFVKEEIFVMSCDDGSMVFDTRQMQQEKRRAAIEAATNEGIVTLNLYDNGELIELPVQKNKSKNNTLNTYSLPLLTFTLTPLSKKQIKSILTQLDVDPENSEVWRGHIDHEDAFLDRLHKTYKIDLFRLLQLSLMGEKAEFIIKQSIDVKNSTIESHTSDSSDASNKNKISDNSRIAFIGLAIGFPTDQLYQFSKKFEKRPLASIEDDRTKLHDLVNQGDFSLFDLFKFIRHLAPWVDIKLTLTDAELNQKLLEEDIQHQVDSTFTTQVNQIKTEHSEHDKVSDGNPTIELPIAASVSSNNSSPPVGGYILPPHLYTHAQQIERYGIKQQENMYPYVKLFDLHILVQSMLDNMNDGLGIEHSICNLDSGGYFITNSGIEKIIMFRHALVPNIVIKQYKKGNGKSLYFCECRSNHIDENRSSSTFFLNFIPDKLLTIDEETGKLTDVGRAVGRVSQLLQNIPFVLWMRALGIESSEDIQLLYQSICGGMKEKASFTEFQRKCLLRCIEDDHGIKTTHDAILRLGKAAGGKTATDQWFIGRKKLRTEVFPHIGKAAENSPLFEVQCRAKARFLCYMLHALFLVIEHTTEMDPHVSKKTNMYLTSKDSYFYRIFQSIEMMAPLIQQYLKPHFNKFIPQTILKRLDRGLDVNIYEIFYMSKISKNLNFNLSMGVWHATPGKKTNTGVSQNMARHNLVDTMSQHDKSMNPIHKDGKQIEPRLLPETGIGVACCVDSPEGESAGLHRQLAQFVHQTLYSDPTLLLGLLEDPLDWIATNGIVYSTDKGHAHTMPLVLKPDTVEYDRVIRDGNIVFWNVMINENPLYITTRPDALLEYIRYLRLNSGISSEISSFYEMGSDPWDVRLFSIADEQTLRPTGTLFQHEGQLYDPFQPSLNEAWCDQTKWLKEFTLHIHTHAARNVTQHWVARNLYKLRTIDISRCTNKDLHVMGLVEYLDVNEKRDCLIAVDAETFMKSVTEWEGYISLHKLKGRAARYPASKRTNTYTHVELDPSFIYGMCAAMIKFAPSNPPARLTFQAHMGKHAQGQATTNMKTHRIDTNFNELWYPERPLVGTDVQEALSTYKLSTSYNSCVAIEAGDNEEDSQEVNLCTSQIGFNASSVYKMFKGAERKHKNKLEKIGRFQADQCSSYKIGCDYSKLDERGIIREGSSVDKNTILIQKSLNGVDKSLCYRGTKPGVVDKVRVFYTDANLLVVKGRIRESRPSETGDKNASEHAQKGTIKTMQRRENMSYASETSIFPDVKFNPSAFISRMTFGMNKEGELGLIGAIQGMFMNASPFSKQYVKQLNKLDPAHAADPSREELQHFGEQLHALGRHPQGAQSCIDMRTGKRLKGANIWMGILAMQKLKQMACEKLRARGLGPVSYATRQPTDGKNNDGGLKTGGLELCSLISYGAAQVVWDKMLLSSDPTYVQNCQHCHNRCIFVRHMDFTYCFTCDKANSATNTLSSATFGLFCNELQAIGISIKLHTKPI
ncbi:MAG: DNA-directed RNA polymerase II [Sylvanvirus sp.]|uniref:DNA-directed RNA polymerase n=1 Tax=Sylvanvirus sp. TaxID=2487774 RepID=A0A3G5ALK5_9VIRU|nr:MAG: DNA-directed RNA polymerase II [Sylvanvirus sp.]